MKHLILATFLTFSSYVLAQNFVEGSAPANPNAMKQEGQIFSVRLEMGQPIRIFVVGKEEAKFDFNEMKLTVKRLKPYPGKVLKLDQKDGSYFISESLDLKKDTQLEVTTKVRGSTEKFKFNLKQSKP